MSTNTDEYVVTPEFVLVRVTATVTFDAYVRSDIGVGVAGQIEHEMADAVEHYAPHLSDQGEGDALVALVSGAQVEVVDLDVQGSADPATVREAVERTEAYK